jgi:hypothetical protein
MIFSIKKGKHSSNRWFHKILNWKGRTFQAKVIFDDTCNYDIGMPDQLDVNKLIGFSLSSNHHDNSVRFGWRSQDGVIIIYAYSYIDGSRIIKEMGAVELGEEILVSLEKGSSGYIFTLKQKDLSRKFELSTSLNPTYMLWPYFGGNQTAPHDMKIRILVNI